MKQKRMRLVVIVIAIVVLVIIISKVTSPKQEKEKKSYADRQENGTIINTSQKLTETKRYNGLEFTNIKFSSTESVTSLVANVKNTTSEEMPAQVININILDKDRNVMASYSSSINKLKPGETILIDSGIAANYVDAYDIEFVAP